MYPYAISLIENVNTYVRTCERVNEKKTCQLLVAGMKRDVQSLIMDMSNLVWDSYKLEGSVQKFSESIYNFREKVDELIAVESTIEQHLKDLDNCDYTDTKFCDVLYEIQKSIDYLNLKGFSNLPQWVAKFDDEIEKKLSTRLIAAIRSWIDVLMRKTTDEASNIRQKKDDLDYASTYSSSLMDDDKEVVQTLIEPKIRQITVEILIKNQVLYVSPSIEDAREHLVSQLYEFGSVITTQKRIQHSRYQVSMEAESEYKMTYKNLLNKFPNGLKLFDCVFGAIENILGQAAEFVKTWLNFQSLWDLQPEVLYQKLGTNLSAWMSCLNEMKESRKSFDTQETQRHFGPIRIDYTKVQSKVNVKYDAWHKDVLG
jgi:dynein heavy chain 1